ncbi:MAG: glutathione S-transferase [Kangiellaceae bacterium]|nr:glutathione S-transferase [Kangiellaceae bacterium]
MSTTTNLPILYSFRRCPYAMRARLAVEASGVKVELREILLRDKPVQMTSVSDKGTVPVLILPDGKVIDESLDIMCWALEQNDPKNLLTAGSERNIDTLIETNDFHFKPKLDKYKYAVRFPEKSAEEYREDCEFFLAELDDQLKSTRYLLGIHLSIADLAIFPFIRQFASVDSNWFENTEFVCLKNWLKACVDSVEFQRVMKKYQPWELNQEVVVEYL